MPLKTFINLKPERQKEILTLCMQEFALKDYQQVNLTELIKKLGIAKGSFYRYFSTKRDLYEYLIDYAIRLNRNFFEEIFTQPVEDILGAWVRFYLAAARQDNADPVFGAFGYRIYRDRSNPVLGNVALESKKKGIKIMTGLFREQQKKGRLRRDLSPELMIFTLLQIQEGFMDYLSLKYGIDPEENMLQTKPLFPLPEETLKNELNSFSEILRHGITASQDKNRERQIPAKGEQHEN